MSPDDFVVVYKGRQVGKITVIETHQEMERMRVPGSAESAPHGYRIELRAQIDGSEISGFDPKKEYIRAPDDVAIHFRVLDIVKDELADASTRDTRMNWFNKYIHLIQQRRSIRQEMLRSMPKKELEGYLRHEDKSASMKFGEKVQWMARKENEPHTYNEMTTYAAFMFNAQPAIEKAMGIVPPDSDREYTFETFITDPLPTDSVGKKKPEPKKTLLDKIGDL